MDNTRVRTVELTDFTIHGSEAVNPKPLHRQVASSIKSGKPGRAYSPKFWMTPDGILHFIFPAQSPDGAPIRYIIPKEGIKFILSPDLVDKMKLLEKDKSVL